MERIRDLDDLISRYERQRYPEDTFHMTIPPMRVEVGTDHRGRTTSWTGVATDGPMKDCDPGDCTDA